MEHTHTAQPVYGPQVLTAAEHADQHGGRGDPDSPSGAKYVFDRGRHGRRHCSRCGAVVAPEGGRDA